MRIFKLLLCDLSLSDTRGVNKPVYDMRVVVDLLHIGRNMLGSMIPLYDEFPVVNNDVYPVILSGGSGTRLWPLSRQHYPKQFLPLNSEFTLLQEAAMRLRGVNAPIMVCNEIHRFVLAEQLQQIGVTPSAIFLEPVARNTAPAIALAAFEALTLNENAVLVVLAADHKIERSDVFEVAVNQAINEAQSGTLVTFGVVPDKPETGFGYIQATPGLRHNIRDIKQFVEKPDERSAQDYVSRGDFFWNSGMFVFKAQAFLDELKKYAPQIYRHVFKAHANAQHDLDFIRVDKSSFESCPSDSVDYAVMEQTDKGVVLPVDMGWHDLGSYDALWQMKEKDELGNAHFGDVKNIDSRNCLVHSENQFVATIGIENLVIVATKDSILVTPRDRAQDVKQVVAYLAGSGRCEHEQHYQVHRPWGSYDTITSGKRYQVKRISVKPGGTLSKQLHHHRAEHWVVVSGTALVQIDGKDSLLTENQSTYIPVGSVHRLSNPGKVTLELIEVQSGSYLGEDDIVRLEDNYQRS